MKEKASTKKSHGHETIDPDKVSAAATALKGIAHEVRLAVLCALQEGPMNVSELQAATQVSQSNLSQHLAKMRMLNILSTERRGQQVYYQLVDVRFSEIIQALRSIYC